MIDRFHKLGDRPVRRSTATARERLEFTADAAVARLRNGEDVADAAFDRVYPSRVRERSSRFWTPIAVARRAAELLVADERTRVLDIGSGAGKFCLVGALTTAARFVGIEQREHLVETARATARCFRADRARFVHGDIRDVDWRQFDAFYCFNAFAENHFSHDECYDLSVELSLARRLEDLSFVSDELAAARDGARVVTYHGLGAPMPAGYERVLAEEAGTDYLELWVKQEASGRRVRDVVPSTRLREVEVVDSDLVFPDESRDDGEESNRG